MTDWEISITVIGVHGCRSTIYIADTIYCQSKLMSCCKIVPFFLHIQNLIHNFEILFQTKIKSL